MHQCMQCYGCINHGLFIIDDHYSILSYHYYHYHYQYSISLLYHHIKMGCHINSISSLSYHVPSHVYHDDYHYSFIISSVSMTYMCGNVCPYAYVVINYYYYHYHPPQHVPSLPHHHHHSSPSLLLIIIIIILPDAIICNT